MSETTKANAVPAVNEHSLMFTVHEYPVITLRGEEWRVEVTQTIQGELAAIHMDLLLLDGEQPTDLQAERKHAAEWCAGQLDMYRSRLTGVRLNPCFTLRDFPKKPPADSYTLTAERLESPKWVVSEGGKFVPFA